MTHKPKPQLSHTPTPEQQAIIDAGRNSRISLMVTAYAGCAKTTTLQMLAAALPQEPTLALAFNVKNKKDLEEKFPSYFEVKTMNGLGHAAWARAINKRLTLDPQKLGTLITKTLKEQKIEASKEMWVQLKNLITYAMQQGLVPRPFPHQGLIADSQEVWQDLCDDLEIDSSPLLLDVAHHVLVENIKMAFQGTISFDDQIYCSAMLNGLFPRFPRVIVDEAQDLSPLNHIMLKRCATDRLIVVGDPKQAIYSFRGADSASMAKIKALRKEWIELPLALTFRCPQAVVSRQQAHAPGFVAHESNKKGKVSHVHRPDQESWDKSDLFSHLPHENSTIAVLCRNNAPLLSIAFKFIRSGTGVTMLGRDLGKGLITLSKKLYPLDDTPMTVCAQATLEWKEREVSLALANGKDQKAANATDRAECLLAVIESSGAKNAGELRLRLEALFANESGRITLATGHRAKGLEWDVVLHLDPWRIPSRFAKKPSEIEQEMNLRYVIETRSKNVLLFGDLENFTHN
jgi:hypothetical protein